MRDTHFQPLLITEVFPTACRPELGAFVVALSTALSKQGVYPAMLAPVSRTRVLVDKLQDRGRQSLPTQPNVFRPEYWSISSRLLPWRYLGARLTAQNYRKAIRRSFATAAQGKHWVYAHFFKSGWASLELCEKYGLVSILALGESQPDMLDAIYGPEVVIQTLSRFSGIIAVSRDNERYCQERVPTIRDRLLYLPNAADTRLFMPREKTSIRRELRLPLDTPIAIFCGHFIERKGPLRVLEALKLLRGVKGVFLGQGTQIPCGEEVLFAGPVTREEVAKWLSAADIFVLPSYAEGMSNAILEALASGLPVVVSDRSFNRAFLDESCAVFVEPNDSLAIANGIQAIVTNPLRRHRMSEAARNRATQFSLEERAHQLIEFVCSVRKSGDDSTTNVYPKIHE